MRKLIPFLLVFLLLMVPAGNSKAEIITNTKVTETLNMSWLTGLEIVVQKFNFYTDTEVDSITIPISYKYDTSTPTPPDITLFFGKLDSNKWPFVSSPLVSTKTNIVELAANNEKEITMNIGLTLNGTYALVIDVNGWVDANRYAIGNPTSDYYYILSVGTDVVDGTLTKDFIYRTYRGPLHPYHIDFTESLSNEKNDLVMIIETKSQNNGFSPFGDDNNINFTQVITILGVVAIAGYTASRIRRNRE